VKDFPLQQNIRDKQKATGRYLPVAFCLALWFFGDFEKLIRGAMQQQAQRLNVFIADRAGFIVDHFVEILIAHAKLFVEPIFCFSIFLKQRQHI